MTTRKKLSLARSKLTAAPPDAVMALLLDPESWPRWQPEVSSAEGPRRLTTGDVATGRANLLGFRVLGHSTTTGAGDAFFEQDVIVGVRMRIRYEIERVGDASLITHKLECDLPSGILGRVLSFFLAPRLKRLQETALERLAQRSDGR
jgi:Polyketide cyclase / dehydrase and lipid transport